MAALDSTWNMFPPLFDVGAVSVRLWRHRLRIFALTAGALALALVYLAVTKPTYTATASLLIDPRDARSTNFETVLPGIGADSAAVASQVFVIQSRDLLTVRQYRDRMQRRQRSLLRCNIGFIRPAKPRAVSPTASSSPTFRAVSRHDPTPPWWPRRRRFHRRAKHAARNHKRRRAA